MENQTTGDDINRYLETDKLLDRTQSDWRPMWQLVAEYFQNTKNEYTSEKANGTMLSEHVFDGTGARALRKAVGAMIGLLWQGASKSLVIEPTDEVAGKKGVEAYFKVINKRIAEAIDDPKAGFGIALEEYMGEQLAIGTSGIYSEPGKNSKLSFVCLGVDDCKFDESQGEGIDTIYRKKTYRIEAAIAKFGLSKLSKKTQELYKQKKNCEHLITVLHVIEPRLNLNPLKKGNLNMPFKSVYIEVDEKHLIKETGFEEFPAPIARYYKRKKEIYGRSPATDCLPDNLMLQEVRKDQIVAREKRRDPPLGVYNDGVLGGGVVDTGAHGITVFNRAAADGADKPIFPLFTVGDAGAYVEEIQDMRQAIMDHFNIDRLLDFNNETQMTLGEAEMRDRIRGESLGSLFQRQYSEEFTPVVERVFALLWRMGELGVVEKSKEANALLRKGITPLYVPDAVKENLKNFYIVKYKTPAMRQIESESVNSIMRVWGMAGQIAQATQDPSVFHNLDADLSIREIGKSGTLPIGVIKTTDDVKAMRKQMAAAAEAQNKIAADNANEQIRKTSAEADQVEVDAEKTAEGNDAFG